MNPTEPRTRGMRSWISRLRRLVYDAVTGRFLKPRGSAEPRLLPVAAATAVLGYLTLLMITSNRSDSAPGAVPHTRLPSVPRRLALPFALSAVAALGLATGAPLPAVLMSMVVPAAVWHTISHVRAGRRSDGPSTERPAPYASPDWQEG